MSAALYAAIDCSDAPVDGMPKIQRLKA